MKGGIRIASKRKNGEGTFDKVVKSGITYYRWRGTLGTDPVSGRPNRKTLYARSDGELRQKVKAAVSAYELGAVNAPKKLTVAGWLDQWLSECCQDVKPLTLKTYRSRIRTHIIPALGEVKLSDLTPGQVQAFVNSLGDLSPKSVKCVHGVLCKALGEAVRVKYISGNPASGAILPKVIREEIHPFETEEITAFMDAIRGNPSEPIFFVALNTGMRLSEILGLRWSRVDLMKGTIRVDAQLLVKRGKDSARELGLPKNSMPRTFKAAPDVIECLKTVQKQQKEWRLKAGPVWSNPLDLVFTNEVGQEIPHATIEHRFARILEGAGIEDHRFHDLRHTFTVESIRAGVDVKTLSANLGHSSVSFTLDVYGHVTTAMQDEAANRLQALIQARKNNLK